jgi:Spy/CpxP family protein refolding chaperone
MMSRRLALSLFAAGLLSAQPPAPRAHFGQGQGAPGQGHRLTFEQRLTQTLGLSPTQQNTVHTAMLESHVLGQGMQQKMQAAHQTLAAAVKAGNEDQIEKASSDIATLHQQQTSIHAKTMSKIYASLTADQKTKVGPNLEMLMGPGMGGPGMRGPRPGAPNAPKPAAPQAQD